MAKFLHWTIAALVNIQYATKLVPVDALGVFTDDRLDTWHVGIGPTILALMAVGLAWRLTPVDR
ncbi:MAG: hypothetical protein ACRYG8_45285 [Janthinobacterium lividum]